MVIDSHVLLWWLEGGDKLSGKVREILSGIGGREQEFFVSAVTFWEFRIKELRGQLQTRRSVRDWPDVLRRTGNIHLVDVSTETWLRTAELDWPHRDPADRIIAVTALERGVSVITKDEIFHQPGCPVKVVW